jgi:DNA-binding HxlR family transcriptional regulator
MSTGDTHHISEELNSAIKLIGDDWILCIVGSLQAKELRFCELQRAVTGINPVTLTDRLKRLEKENIIRRKEETLDKLSVVYELTDKGRGILPIITEIDQFAQKFL